MEKAYYTAKSQIVHYKLDFCCWFAPVRTGLMIIGILNIFADWVCLMGIANDGFSPTIMRVQEILIEDFVSKPIPLLAYATELGFSVLLLCGVYRRDIILMRVFMYYTMMAVIMSFLVYSIVIVAVPVQIQLAIVFSTMFQLYIVLLVRSGIVEMRMEQKQYELPTLVKSSILQYTAKSGPTDPTNGQPQEIKITELPKKQEVQITVVEKQDTKKEETKAVIKKDAEVKKDESKNVTEVKIDETHKTAVGNKDIKVAEVKIETEPKEKDDKKDDKKKKEDKKVKEDKVKTKGKDSKKDVKEAWLQTVSEHPKE